MRRSRLQRRLLQLRVQSIQKFVFSQYILLSGTLWMPSLTIAHFFLFFHPHRRKNRIDPSVRTTQIHKNGRPSTGFRPFLIFLNTHFSPGSFMRLPEYPVFPTLFSRTSFFRNSSRPEVYTMITPRTIKRAAMISCSPSTINTALPAPKA